MIALLLLLADRRPTQRYFVLLQNLAVIKQLERAFAFQHQDLVRVRIFGKGVARRARYSRCKQDKEERKKEKRGCPTLRDIRSHVDDPTCG